MPLTTARPCAVHPLILWHIVRYAGCKTPQAGESQRVDDPQQVARAPILVCSTHSRNRDSPRQTSSFGVERKRTRLKKKRSSAQIKAGLTSTADEGAHPKPALSSLQRKSQHLFTETGNTICPSAERFADMFEQGVQFVLQVRGCTDGRVGEAAVAAAHGRVSDGGSLNTNEMARGLREEVMARVQIRTLAVRRPTPAEEKTQLLHALLLSLPASQGAALRDYYVGGWSEEAACKKHGVSPIRFAAVRKSLRVRVGIDRARTDLAFTA
jgi:hypothetical protein